MLIAITSEGPELNSLVAEKFGKSPFIIFFDTGNNTSESLCNPYANLFDGVGIQTAQFIIEHNSSLVITVEIGSNPLRFLNSTGIKVYSCSKKEVRLVVQEFLEEKLSEVEQGSTVNLSRRRHRKKKKKEIEK